jgi:hypothetical protein
LAFTIEKSAMGGTYIATKHGIELNKRDAEWKLQWAQMTKRVTESAKWVCTISYMTHAKHYEFNEDQTVLDRRRRKHGRGHSLL